MKKRCPFCAIARQSRVFYRDQSVIAFLAKDAVAPGQSLVIPNRHVAGISELSEVETAGLLSVCKSIVQVLQSEFGYPGANIILNSGETAGQSIDHVHFHIVPRSVGDIGDPKRWLSDELFAKLYRPTAREFTAVCSRFRSADLLSHAQGAGPAPKLLGSNIRVGSNVIFARDVTLYDGTSIGDDGYIGDGVSIGYRDISHSSHPAATTIGNRAIIRSGTVIYQGVRIGARFDCAHNVVVREGTVIGDDCYFLPGAQVHAHVVIGNNVRIHGFVCNRAQIGDGCSSLGSLVHHFRTGKAGVLEPSPVLERNAVVGVGAVVVGGVTVGEDAVVGAGAVVRKHVPPKFIVVGGTTRRLRKKGTGERSGR